MRGCRITQQACHPPKSVHHGHGNASTVRTGICCTPTGQSQGDPWLFLARTWLLVQPPPRRRGKCPRWASLLFFMCAQTRCFSCGSCQGQDLHRGGCSAHADVRAMGAHLGDDCNFGNHFTWLPPNPRSTWTCWLGGKARLLGCGSFFPCCSRKPPAMWHSQRCHPEQHQPASSLLSLPLHAPTLVGTAESRGASSKAARVPCDPCSLCVPEVSPVHSHLCFPLAWFPVRLSQPGAEQRERVTHTSRSELALFSLSVL